MSGDPLVGGVRGCVWGAWRLLVESGDLPDGPYQRAPFVELEALYAQHRPKVRDAHVALAELWRHSAGVQLDLFEEAAGGS